VSIIVRSIAFNAAFYLSTFVYLIAALPTFFMPRRAILNVAKFWARSNLWLLRVICGIDVDWRGLEKLPRGALLVAAKHQSAWETFALVSLFHDPTFILKRELQWIPIFGWFTIKARMIPVNRGARGQALAAMAERARLELSHDRQIVIFPEGTRRAPGAEPRYKYGVAYLYDELGVPCVPIALNSGLFWRRRSFWRVPGTVRVEILDPIPAGMPREEFFACLQREMESATARLVAEGERDLQRAGAPAMPVAAEER
jgi:1-acyl-sn-glycerol-3-phosphate acyltransferase